MDDPVLTNYRCLQAPKDTKVPKLKFIVDELVATERTYVRELDSLIHFYIKPFEELGNASQIPCGMRGRSKAIFGNIVDLFELHSKHILSGFSENANSLVGLCQVLSNNHDKMLELYSQYCRNKPISEIIRREHDADSCKFFAYCQKRAGHQLSLGAYLLKPVQRITKYPLLLKELLNAIDSSSGKQVRTEIRKALDEMLDLIERVNRDMNILYIYGNENLQSLGTLRVQTECRVYKFASRDSRTSGKAKERHLLVFDGGVMFCKQRTDAPHLSQLFCFKTEILIDELSFAERSKQFYDRFEIWSNSQKKPEMYAVHVEDKIKRDRCIQLLTEMTNPHRSIDRRDSLSSSTTYTSWVSTLSLPTESVITICEEDSGFYTSNDSSFNNSFNLSNVEIGNVDGPPTSFNHKEDILKAMVRPEAMK